MQNNITKKEAISQIINIQGMEWLADCVEVYKEKVMKMFDKTITFRNTWELWENNDTKVESWHIDALKRFNGESIYILTYENLDPIPIIDGILLEILHSDNSYEVRRYLYQNTIYHIHIDFPKYTNSFQYQISTIGYEVYKKTKQPRNITKIHKIE